MAGILLLSLFYVTSWYKDFWITGQENSRKFRPHLGQSMSATVSLQNRGNGSPNQTLHWTSVTPRKFGDPAHATLQSENTEDIFQAFGERAFRTVKQALGVGTKIHANYVAGWFFCWGNRTFGLVATRGPQLSCTPRDVIHMLKACLYVCKALTKRIFCSAFLAMLGAIGFTILRCCKYIPCLKEWHVKKHWYY